MNVPGTSNINNAELSQNFTIYPREILIILIQYLQSRLLEQIDLLDFVKYRMKMAQHW